MEMITKDNTEARNIQQPISEIMPQLNSPDTLHRCNSMESCNRQGAKNTMKDHFSGGTVDENGSITFAPPGTRLPNDGNSLTKQEPGAAGTSPRTQEPRSDCEIGCNIIADADGFHKALENHHWWTPERVDRLDMWRDIAKTEISNINQSAFKATSGDPGEQARGMEQLLKSFDIQKPDILKAQVQDLVDLGVATATYDDQHNPTSVTIKSTLAFDDGYNRNHYAAKTLSSPINIDLTAQTVNNQNLQQLEHAGGTTESWAREMAETILRDAGHSDLLRDDVGKVENGLGPQPWVEVTRAVEALGGRLFISNWAAERYHNQNGHLTLGDVICTRDITIVPPASSGPPNRIEERKSQ